MRHRNVPAILKLISNGADIDDVDHMVSKNTVLVASYHHYSTIKHHCTKQVFGFDDVIKLLVEKGATVDSLDHKALQ